MATVESIFPKVYSSHSTSRVSIKLSEYSGEKITIKIQPMEAYSIPHTPVFRIDEEDRYPYLAAQGENDLRDVDFSFIEEQRYSVRVKADEEIIYHGYLYALDEDLSGLTAYKGDTHLHSCRSDGEGTPFEVAVAYRAANYDFIAITDHHRYAPSLEAREQLSPLTDLFTVFPGEEVHNKDMGYFHIVNFNGSSSVNDIIETDDEYVEGEIERILKSASLPENVDKRSMAYRIFVSEHIRKCGGVSIFAHPYWDVFGEYHCQTSEAVAHLRRGDFDALELLAGCDRTGNGNNIQVALWADLRADGVRIPIVGASDSHSTTKSNSLFNKQFSIVFARSAEEIPDAIKAERSVAVLRRSDSDFEVFGSFRLVKYARFLLDEYLPLRLPLAVRHAEALAKRENKDIQTIEEELRSLDRLFFNK